MQLLSKQTLSVRAITREETHAGEARPRAASSGVCPSTAQCVPETIHFHLISTIERNLERSSGLLVTVS